MSSHKMAIIEDDPFYQDYFSNILLTKKIELFKSLNDFDSKVNPHTVNKYSHIISDFDFYDHDLADMKFGEYCRKILGFKGILVITSVLNINSLISKKERLFFNGFIPKSSFDLKSILQLSSGSRL